MTTPHVELGEVDARCRWLQRRPVYVDDRGQTAGKLRLGGECHGGLVLDQHPVDVEASGTDRHDRAGCADREPGTVQRPTGVADDVGDRAVAQVVVDVALLVPLGVEADTTLLLEDVPVVLGGIECPPRGVRTHCSVPSIRTRGSRRPWRRGAGSRRGW